MKRNIFFKTLLFILSASFCQTLMANEDKPSTEFLKLSKTIELKNQPGHFDFMQIDVPNHRLLAAHTGAKNLVIADLNTDQILSTVPVGEAQGVAIDSKNSQYIVGDAGEHKVVFINSKNFKVTAEVKTDGPVDAIALDTKHDLIFADEDDGNKVWVISTKKKQIIGTVEIPGVPEYVLYSKKQNKVLQNIKDKNLLTTINPVTLKVESSISTIPVESPHGLAMDSDRNILFIAGHNDSLLALNMKNSKQIDNLKITAGSDQIDYDTSNKIVYCATKGFISAVQEKENVYKVLAKTEIPRGAHTLAVDSSQHSVWISYSDKNSSYLQKYTRSEP